MYNKNTRKKLLNQPQYTNIPPQSTAWWVLLCKEQTAAYLADAASHDAWKQQILCYEKLTPEVEFWSLSILT